MRIESQVTSISWIPSEAVEGMTKMPFEMGLGHYDAPLPDVIDDLEALRDADRFRFANHLKAWIEVEDGRITGYGHAGGGLIGSTTMQLGSRSMTVAAVAFPDRRPEPIVTETSVRFVQTAGGRTGMPMPRRVKHPPFIQITSPLAWTTLALTINADGTSTHDAVNASQFPRHWIYDQDNRLVQKTGVISFKDWALDSHTPWGDEDSPALVTEVETALEHELSGHIMRSGSKPRIETYKPGTALMTQGEPGQDLYLLLDGVVSVEVDGNQVAHLGPGVVIGERALLESGKRTSTVKSVTRCRVAIARAEDIDPSRLADLAQHHRRESL
jgi:hypothetical protein